MYNAYINERKKFFDKLSEYYHLCFSQLLIPSILLNMRSKSLFIHILGLTSRSDLETLNSTKALFKVWSGIKTQIRKPGQLSWEVYFTLRKKQNVEELGIIAIIVQIMTLENNVLTLLERKSKWNAPKKFFVYSIT